MHVLVAGGSGFIGRPLCRVLAERGHDVTAASRSPDPDSLPSGVEPATLDVTEPDLTEQVAGHDAVVNLVALPSHETMRDRSHRTVHRDGTRHLLRASEATDVERFVQLSGLGVDAGIETAYFRAKREAERLVEDSALDWVIVRPSVVFGDGCAFLPFIERVTPPVVAPLPAGGRMRLQPIWVEDLAPMLAECVVEDRHVGQHYDIGGPERLTLAEIVQAATGVRRVVAVPDSLAATGFALAEAAPGVPFDRDQFRVFDHDNVAEQNDVSAFDVAETDLTTLGAYLAAKQ
ncbi:MAG: SDR family oxidoreductase [Halorientalis sp.]